MADLSFISPFLIADNLQASVAYYVDKLGFEVRFTGPDDDPYFAIIGRGPVWIMLKAITPDVKPIPNHIRHEWARWDAYISVPEPDALFEEYTNRGAMFHKPIHNNSDNLRGFEVIDADGYILFFGRTWP